MPVIAVSSDSPQMERNIAAGIAQRLGYALLSRELLDQVAQKLNIGREELDKALDSHLGPMPMRLRRRKELVTHIQAACLERLGADKVVTYGLAAHLYVKGVSHVMRVRLLAGSERLAKELGQEPDKAAKQMESRQKERSRISQELFGVDESDPAAYDMVLSLANLEPEQTVEMVCEAAAFPKFQAMTYSRKCLADCALASQVRQVLMHRFPGIKLHVNDGTVVASMQSFRRDRRRKQEEVRELACGVPGVRFVEVHVINNLLGRKTDDAC